MVAGWMSELRLAARMLWRRPGYAAIAMLTLGLGIGANVAIFTVVNSVLLRPLPWPGSDRIVQIRHHAPGLQMQQLENSAATLTLYRESARTIEHVAGLRMQQTNLTGVDPPTRVQVVATGPEFFDVFATRPVLGRAFQPQDVREGAAPVAILMYDTWRTRFGGDPAVLGRHIDFDGMSTEIVGVMPRGFTWPDPHTVALLPLYVDPAVDFGMFGMRGLARLAPGATVASARREITALQRRIPDRFPDMTQDFLDRAGWSVSLDRLRDVETADIAPSLWVLFGTVGLVLLIAGANVANLFLVRAESRQRELAVRAALGGSRWRLARVFLAESTLLGAAGGVAGFVLALLGVRALVAFGPGQLPRLHEVRVDATVVGFGAALSLLAGLALGMLPLPRTRRASLTATLRDGGRGATAGRERYRARRLLIVLQVSLALVLLVGTGLMLRSVLRLRAVDPGIHAGDVLTVGVSRGAGDPAAARVFYQSVLDRIGAIPGVIRVGATNALPLAGGFKLGSFQIESKPRTETEVPPVTMFCVVTPGFFESLGIPLRAGRAPEASDQEGDAPVAWVNEMFAEQYLDRHALGEHVRLEGPDSTWLEIAGVVGDVRMFGLKEPVRPMMYVPMSSRAPADIKLMSFAIHSAQAPGVLLAAVRQAIAAVDRNVPITSARTMDDIIAASVASASFTVLLLGIASVVALVLGGVGLYGVIAYVVSQRRQEMGLRIALGARPAEVRAMVVRQGLTVTLVGVGIGLPAALALTRLLASLLFEVSARDPLTFAVVPVVLIAVGWLAAWLPARRAAAVSPLLALRED